MIQLLIRRWIDIQFGQEGSRIRAGLAVFVPVLQVMLMLHADDTEYYMR